MRVRRNFTVATIAEAQSGDLVKMTYGNHQTDLAIVYDADETHANLIVLKTTADVGYAPYADRLRKDFDCVNYGSKWFIEPMDTFENQRDNTRTEFGAIAFLPDAEILCLGLQKQGPGSQPRYFDLSAFRLHQGTPHDAYVIKRWRLWLNEEQRRDPDCDPLIDFTAYSPPPR